MSSKTYYLHLSIWKVYNQNKHELHFWTNDSGNNAQHGTTVRCFPITSCQFETPISFADAHTLMKKKWQDGEFDHCSAMGDLTVKDLRMLGVCWQE